MRGMLLCAGLGTRLRPLTERLPKPLVPVLNRPMLLYNLTLLREAGVTELVVNLHHLGRLVREALGDGSALGMAIRYSEEPILLGTGGGVRAVRDFLGEGTCIVANGDTLCEADLGGALARHRERGAIATLILHPHDQAEAFGAVRIEADGRVASIGEVVARAGAEASDAHLFAGVHILEPAFLTHLSDESPSCIIRTAYRRLIESGAPIYGDPAARRWHDCGTVARLLDATIDLLRHPESFAHAPRAAHHETEAGPGARVEGPVLFGPGTRVGADACVGPDVVLGAGARVEPGARVRRAIVWPGMTVADDVEGQVVG
jgi:mannose-1-phosphate guanylyltransferase